MARPMATSAIARSIERLEQLADVPVVLDHTIGILRPGGCLEAVARPNSAVDDPLVDVVAEIVVVGSLRVQEHIAGNVHFHAKLGAGNCAVLDALAADIADPRADEGVPGAQVPLVAETQRRPAAPSVIAARADGVEADQIA